MKKLNLLVLLLVLTLVFTACGTAEPEETVDEPTTEETTEETSEEVDAVTTASIVSEGEALLNGLSEDGTWIVATLNDISVDEEVVVAGEFTHRDEVARKLGLYTQDSDRNVTARFTLEAPKMTVKSENFRLQGGTFKGDVYVEAKGFELRDAAISGDLYFTNKEALDTFMLHDNANVTGSIKLEEVDLVSTASLVTDTEALVNAMSADGTWIAATYFNMSLDEDLVIDGEFTHRDEIARKLGLYTQDSDRNVTARFTLSAPKMVVKSENFRLQGGIFEGDVYVEANGFHLRDAVINGNVVFASNEYQDSFVNEGEINGDVTVE